MHGIRKRDWSVLVLPDSQFGSHDKKFHADIVELVRVNPPDLLVHVGDFLDCDAPSRWSKGKAEEFAPTLQKEIDDAQAFLTAVRDVYDGPFILKSGNHDERIEEYAARHAPALAGLRCLGLEELLDLGSFGVRLARQPVPIAPGWVLAHGHEGSLSQVAGSTALALAKKFGASVVCGHTHRAGLVAESSGYGGRLSTLYGMEVGHAMDIRKADYLEGGSANWQQAVGWLNVSGRRVQPRLYYRV